MTPFKKALSIRNKNIKKQYKKLRKQKNQYGGGGDIKCHSQSEANGTELDPIKVRGKEKTPEELADGERQDRNVLKNKMDNGSQGRCGS